MLNKDIKDERSVATGVQAVIQQLVTKNYSISQIRNGNLKCPAILIKL